MLVVAVMGTAIWASQKDWQAGADMSGQGVRVGDVLGGTFELSECLEHSEDFSLHGAHDVQLGREVLVKSAASARAIEQLRREAHMLAPLSHPHLPRVFAYGTYEAGEYLVTERVHGSTLAAIRAPRGTTPFSVSDTLAILIPLADALAALHAGGHVHGQLTTSCVIIEDGGRVVLRNPILVAELVPGKGGDVNRDLDALCDIAYELLAGCQRRRSTGTTSANECGDAATPVLEPLWSDRSSAVAIAAQLRTLAKDVKASLAGRPTTPHTDPARILVGGRYRLGRRLGSGGMGTVYEAHHVQLGRAFALKVMSADFVADPAARACFAHEARLASELVHPNVVTVTDFGDDRQLGPYMVMELVGGVSLAALTEKPLPLGHACDLLGQVAAAVSYIHSRGVIHGDIKAENILIVTEYVGTHTRQVAKLIDFGLARRIAAVQPTSDLITGTPHYIAPERVSGEPASIATDVYALGVLAYLMIAGSLPFDGTEVEIMGAHRMRSPDALTHRRGSPVADALQGLVGRAMHKSVAGRIPSAADLVRELDAAVDTLELARVPHARQDTLMTS